MPDIYDELKAIFKGELDTSTETLETYSHDASLFELKPKVVARPKDSQDIKSVVQWVSKNKSEHPTLAITPRSAGTDMSGGAVGESIVLDMTAHFKEISKLTREYAQVQPGVYFRDFDKKTAELGVVLPSYPASRDLCTLGGMTSNNSGGEKSLQYGKTDNFVQEISVILSDGNEYVIKPLTKDGLVRKMAQGDFEGDLYKKTFDLLEKHYDEIQAARPRVSKDSTGYHLWNVWNRDTGVFDLTKLFVGAQGTLGVITDVKVRLVERPEYSGVLVGYLKNIDQLGDIITTVLKHDPATFESFDDNTLWLSFKFFFSFLKKLGFKRWVRLALQLIPDGLMLVRGIPQLVLMIEFTGNSVDEVEQKIDEMKKDLAGFPFTYLEKNETEDKSQKFWIMRRESFNLLRSKVKDKHTAPFIDDFIVPPDNLSAFLPKLRKIIKKYKLFATIAGHMGDGNFHVIPLMKIEDPHERAKLQPAMKEVNELVLKYDGSISGEHNDGMVRGPWLERMYGPSVFGHMKAIKQLYDPQNIFNPHKKTDADWEFSFSHIRQHF
jgi:FAD/FMN-containing dehydrogenase